MIRKISILIILLQLLTYQLLLAQSINRTYKSDPKVRKQFDYFDYSMDAYSMKLENSLLPSGNMTVYMSYWNDWKKTNSERVFQAVQRGLDLLKDSIDNPLDRHILTIALSPDAPEPLYRFKKIVPQTTDFVEINNEVLSVKHDMDSVIVIDYIYNVLTGRDSSLRPIIYTFAIKDLSMLDLGPEWKKGFDSLNVVRQKGLGWQNFRSRIMLVGGVGVGLAMNGTAYPALDGGLYFSTSTGTSWGESQYFGYGASFGYAGFNGNRGLYLFHGVELGAFSGSGLNEMTVQKLAWRVGVANIKTFKPRNGFVIPVDDKIHSAAYMGITFPLGRTISFTFDFASNFRFADNNHVGYFGGKMKFYFRLL